MAIEISLRSRHYDGESRGQDAGEKGSRNQTEDVMRGDRGGVLRELGYRRANERQLVWSRRVCNDEDATETDVRMSDDTPDGASSLDVDTVQ